MKKTNRDFLLSILNNIDPTFQKQLAKASRDLKIPRNHSMKFWANIASSDDYIEKGKK